jgi:hypothetical protein
MKEIRILSLNEWLNEQFNTHKYNSFSELTEQDLYDIAKWGLLNDFSSSGAWDDTDDDLEKAIQNIISGFKLLLKDKFPDGFNNIPKIVKIYRMVVLKSPEELNREHLGYSWFSNPNRITDPYFKQQLWHLKTEDLFLITAEIPESKIDIPRSLFQRDMVWIENEIVLKDDTNIKILSLEKIK